MKIMEFFIYTGHKAIVSHWANDLVGVCLVALCPFQNSIPATAFSIDVEVGERIVFSINPVVGDKRYIAMTYEYLAQCVYTMIL